MLKKVVSYLKKYNDMRDKKKLEGLIKVIKQTYIKNPEMQKVIDASMIGVCAQESISPKQVFFI